MNPGEPERPLWAAQEGRVGSLSLTSPDLMGRVLDPTAFMAEMKKVGLAVGVMDLPAP